MMKTPEPPITISKQSSYLNILEWISEATASGSIPKMMQA